mgnify:CR=1 FL=1
MGKRMSPELAAAMESARAAREEFLQKHPPKSKTLEEKFGKAEAARMRAGAEALARHDGDLDK